MPDAAKIQLHHPSLRKQVKNHAPWRKRSVAAHQGMRLTSSPTGGCLEIKIFDPKVSKSDGTRKLPGRTAEAVKP
jgi:hypothetical protein